MNAIRAGLGWSILAVLVGVGAGLTSVVWSGVRMWWRSRRPHSRNVIAYQRETVLGALPPMDGGKMRIAPATGVMRKSAPAEVWGDATFDCPKCSAPIATSGNFVGRRYLFGGGVASVHMAGVLCGACHSSYTVELTEKRPNDPDEAGFRTAGTLTFTPEPNPPAEAYREWITLGKDETPDLGSATEEGGAEPD